MAKDGASPDEAVDIAVKVGIAAEIGAETEARSNTRHLDYKGVRAEAGVFDVEGRFRSCFDKSVAEYSIPKPLMFVGIRETIAVNFFYPQYHQENV